MAQTQGSKSTGDSKVDDLTKNISNLNIKSNDQQKLEENKSQDKGKQDKATTNNNNIQGVQQSQTGGSDNTNSQNLKEDEKTSEPESTRNLIVNFLPPDMKEAELESLFSKYGSIEHCKIVIDLNTKKSRGYGFIKYYKSADANNAIKNLNGFEIRGKYLKVALARPKSKDIQNANIYITNIPFQYTTADLRKHFEQFGEIIECRILKDPSTKKPRGVGFVRMDTHHHAINALHKLEGTTKFRMKLAQRYAYMQNNNNNNNNNTRQSQGFVNNYNQNFSNQNPNQFSNIPSNFNQFGGPFNPSFNSFHGNMNNFSNFPNNNRSSYYQRSPNINQNYNSYSYNNQNNQTSYQGYQPGNANSGRRRNKQRKYYSKKQN